MWIIYAILVHIALLGSIFVIYFRSPVITGLSPQKELKNPPAKRLVLFVTDGLRAESFYKNHVEDLPHIRRLIHNQGLVGISQTRVPTESRPGHIALIAGLYEDPSAVLRGWKANPIDFDNLFNRSSYTYAFGAMDVLHIFSKITGEDRLMIDAYDEYDFTGKDNASAVDQWVFKKAANLLYRKGEALKNDDRVVFFLHLLGLDIAGHIHKPGSKLFLETLHSTEEGIFEIFKHFEMTFNDGKTAYVLTSDHGMTDHGSHGAGDPHETETPFFIWGAGVNTWYKLPRLAKFNRVKGENISLNYLEQAQLATLMSALIGVPPPMNSFGTLPRGILNVTEEYKANAVYVNALQLIAQFEALTSVFGKGAFSSYLPSFQRLNAHLIRSFRQRTDSLILIGDYFQATEESFAIMQDTLQGIEYYHTYYQKALLLCTSLTFIIWMFCLITFVIDDAPMSTVIPFIKPSVVALLLLAFIYLQNIPYEVGFYMILPVLLWFLSLRSSHGKQRWLKSLMTAENATMAFILVLSAVLMVISFFRREFISVVFFLFMALKVQAIGEEDTKFLIWFAISVFITIFPLLPDVMGERNDTFLLCGALLTLARSFLVKSNLPKWIYAAAIAGLLNAAFCIFKHNNQEEIPLICRVTSWLFLFHSLAAPFYVPYKSPKTQVELIFFSLTTAYLLLCTSFEAIFIVLLGSQLMLTYSHKKELIIDPRVAAQSEDLRQSFQYALAILLYTFFAFFGTGNIASVSSFDPNIMRCFLATFSPWIIMALVIVKLFLPMLLIVVIIYGTVGSVLNEQRVFIAMLFICDIMGLNFLFFVRNKGSWLEIGSSISHFVIMEVTTLVLVLTTYVVKIYLRTPKAAGSVVKLK